MISLAIVLAILGGLAAWLMSLGAKSARAATAERDAIKEADDARSIAAYERHRADLERDAAIERERVAALPPADLARAVGRMLDDPFAGDPGAAPSAPVDPTPPHAPDRSA